MAEILIVGGISYDHIVKANVGCRFDQPGGPGTYASLAAALVPQSKVNLATILPAQLPELSHLLQSRGIGLSLSFPLDLLVRVWMLDSPEGRRVVPVFVGAGQSELGIPEDQVGLRMDFPPGLEFDGLLLCAPDYGQNLSALPRAAFRGVDPDQTGLAKYGWKYVEKFCRWATIFMPSRVQLGMMGDDPLKIARRIRDSYAMTVVAKMDREGIYVFPVEGVDFQVIDRNVQVIETTGAGDSLAGATLAALANKIEFKVAVSFGVAAARITLGDWGPAGLMAALDRGFPIDTLLYGIEIIPLDE